MRLSIVDNLPPIVGPVVNITGQHCLSTQQREEEQDEGAL